MNLGRIFEHAERRHAAHGDADALGRFRAIGQHERAKFRVDPGFRHHRRAERGRGGIGDADTLRDLGRRGDALLGEQAAKRAEQRAGFDLGQVHGRTSSQDS
jgi:hypothetical protein